MTSISIKNNNQKLNISSLRFGSVKSTENGDIEANSADANLSTLLSTEISSRQSSYTSISSALVTEISNRSVANVSLNSAIGAEMVARSSVDVSLSSAIGAEIAGRFGAISGISASLSGEISTRIMVTESISAIVSEEVSARLSVDAVQSVLISGEIVARASSAVSLSSAISGEMSARSTADVSLNSKLSVLTLSLSSEILNRISGDSSILSVVQSMVDGSSSSGVSEEYVKARASNSSSFLHTSNTNSRQNNYGQGWKMLDNTLLAQQTQTYFRLRCSGNGQVLVIPNDGHNTKISLDYGKSYASVANFNSNLCSMSENGKFGILFNTSNSSYTPFNSYSLDTTIFSSITTPNRVENRVGVSSLGAVTCCDVSVTPSGKFALMAGSSGGNTGRLYLLNNYGSSATTDFVNLGYGQWTGCCMGANENSLVAVKDNRYIYGTTNLQTLLDNPDNQDVLYETDTMRNGILLPLLCDIYHTDASATPPIVPLVSPTQDIRWIKCSTDSKIIMVGSAWNGNKSRILISRNYGSTFEVITATPLLEHYDIAMSSSGMYMATICYEAGNSNSGLYVSCDYGVTWTKANLPANTPTTSFWGVCMSSDGTHIYVLERNIAYSNGYQNYANKIYHYDANALTFETNATKLDYPAVGSAYFENSRLYVYNGSTWVSVGLTPPT